MRGPANVWSLVATLVPALTKADRRTAGQRTQGARSDARGAARARASARRGALSFGNGLSSNPRRDTRRARRRWHPVRQMRASRLNPRTSTQLAAASQAQRKQDGGARARGVIVKTPGEKTAKQPPPNSPPLLFNTSKSGGGFTRLLVLVRPTGASLRARPPHVLATCARMRPATTPRNIDGVVPHGAQQRHPRP